VEVTERCLSEFARGLRTLASLESCLDGKVHVRFWDTDQRSAELLHGLPKVNFTRADLDAQLRRFLARELSARDLSDWAGAMRLLGCFVVEDDEPMSSQVWDLMDEIMSPDVWGPISVDSVLDLRRRLDALTT
jgi:hypothetical protein